MSHYNPEKYVKWKVRKAVLERDKACVYCGLPVARIRDDSVGGPNEHWRAYDNQGRPFHFDHRIPFSEGGASDETNIVLACAACNLKRPKGPLSRDYARVVPSRDKSKCPECRRPGYRVLPWIAPDFYDPEMIKVVCVNCTGISYIAPVPFKKGVRIRSCHE